LGGGEIDLVRIFARVEQDAFGVCRRVVSPEDIVVVLGRE